MSAPFTGAAFFRSKITDSTQARFYIDEFKLKAENCAYNAIHHPRSAASSRRHVRYWNRMARIAIHYAAI